MRDAVVTDVLTTHPPAVHPAVAKLIGGRRGIVDGAVPPLVFVATNAVGGLLTDGSAALTIAAGSAILTALTLVAVRLIRRESLKQAAQGLMGLGVAIAFAFWSGEARDFFLPGMYVDAFYGTALLLSALVGRPLIGTIFALLFQTGPGWRQVRPLRRTFTLVTLGWAAIYAARTVVQVQLYGADRPELLAVSKLVLGWPLTIAAVALTLTAVRRAQRR